MATPDPQPKSTTGHTLRPLLIPWPVRFGFKLVSAASPASAARLAKQMFFAPPMAVRMQRKPEPIPVPPGESFAVLSRGENVKGTIWDRTEGKGPTVVLVHGWAGQGNQLGAMVEPLLSAGFRVISADMPAHGESDGKLSSVVHFADALQSLNIRFGPFHGLVAHSFGAAAATYAFSRGLAVDRAVFFAPPARFDTFFSRFQDALDMSPGVRRRLTADAETWLGIRFEDAMPIALAPHLKVPLLVIQDVGDREVHFEEGAALARAWPGATLRPTEQLGHLRILRDPSSLAAMTAFLGSHSTVTSKNFTELSSRTSSRLPSPATTF